MAQLNFVYLTGAGASALALPTTATFRERLVDFAKAYQKYREDLSFQRGAKGTEPLKHEAKFLECLGCLSDQAAKHASIDTYAKKLIVRGERQKLLELKATLSAYFVLEQSIRPVDPRYDSFLASIIAYQPGRRAVFPTNVKVITWNYDMQLEKAFYEYYPDEEQVVRQIALGRDIVRMNGVAGTVQDGHIGPSYTNVLKPFTINTIIDTLEMFGRYIEDPSSNSPDINFAWEQPDFWAERLCGGIAGSADILTVIGYSFPFFNRETDRKILGMMKKISKVYVQAPKQFHDDLRDRLKALSPDLATVANFIGDTERFYVPYEFQ